MDKLRQRQEITAYRIVRRNVLKITNGIPFANMGKFTFEALVNSNVTVSQIKEMFLEIYTTLGKPQYKRSQKDGIDFEMIISHWLNDSAGLRIVSVHQTLIDSIVKVIAKGYEDNISVADITRNLQRQFGWYKYQALRIARTETTTATNYATVLASQNSEWVQVKKWISVQDARTRRPPHSIYDHLDMNGQVVDEFSPFFVGGENIEFPGDPKAKAGNVVNCYLPNTIISSKILSGQKSFYSGKAIEIITRNGKRLSVTPNHYILTKDGFIKAKDINVGDNLITNKVNTNRIIRLVDNYVNKKFFRVENVFSSLKYFWLSKQVMSTSLDFDKDGEFMNGNIDIVYPEVKLINSGKSFFYKIFSNFSFINTFFIRIIKSRFCSFYFFSSRNISTFTRFMSFLYLAFPLCFRHFRPLKSFALGLGSCIDTQRFKMIGERLPTDSEFIFELIKTNSRIIEFDDVVDIRDFDFTGHVYDFTSYSGVNITNNIYTSNCRCKIVYLLKEDENGLPIRKIKK